MKKRCVQFRFCRPLGDVTVIVDFTFGILVHIQRRGILSEFRAGMVHAYSTTVTIWRTCIQSGVFWFRFVFFLVSM